MKNSGPLVIAILCSIVALLVAVMAAPARRGVALGFVSVPFGVAAAIALDWYVRERRKAAARPPRQSSECSIADWLGDIGEFLAAVPQLEQSFAARAGSVEGAQPRSQRELEEFCARHGETIEPGTERFREFVAAYGEIIRRATGGEWASGHWLHPQEPVVRSGRFPYFTHRVLRDAISLLDAAEDMKYM